MIVREIASTETHALRLQVLRPGQPKESALFPFDNVPGSFHLGAFDGKKLVSTASFHPESLEGFQARNPFRLRGMATYPDWQGKGFGAQILASAFIILRSKECDFLWCNARQNAFGFYEKLGFKYGSDLFDIPGVGPHKKMHINPPKKFLP